MVMVEIILHILLGWNIAADVDLLTSLHNNQTGALSECYTCTGSGTSELQKDQSYQCTGYRCRLKREWEYAARLALAVSFGPGQGLLWEGITHRTAVQHQLH